MEGRQRLQAQRDGLVERGREIEEGDRDLREDVGLGPAGEPRSEVAHQARRSRRDFQMVVTLRV